MPLSFALALDLYLYQLAKVPIIRRCKGKASCCCLIVQGSSCSPHFVWWFLAILVRHRLLIASHDFHICRRQNSRAMGEMYFTECHSQAMTLSFAILSSELCLEITGFSSFSPLTNNATRYVETTNTVIEKGGYIL